MVLMEASGLSAVTQSLTSGISGIATDALGAIGSVVPVALPIVGGFLVVKIGIKIFKTVSHA